MNEYPVQNEPRFDQGAGDEVPRLIDDEIVAKRLAELSELVKDMTDDLDQMAADLDDQRLAIASSVAWLLGDNARQIGEQSTMLRSRLTFLAGQHMYPLGPEG